MLSKLFLKGLSFSLNKSIIKVFIQKVNVIFHSDNRFNKKFKRDKLSELIISYRKIALNRTSLEKWEENKQGIDITKSWIMTRKFLIYIPPV